MNKMTDEFGFCRDCKYWQRAKEGSSKRHICWKLTAFLQITVNGGRFLPTIDPVEVPSYFGCSIFKRDDKCL